MRDNSQRALQDFLAHADQISDEILDDTKEMLGSMPFILPVLRERPEIFALTSIADEMICRPAHLSPKTAELVALGAAAATRADYCLKVHIHAAVKEGASREEIYDTVMIAALIGKTRILATALREMEEMLPARDCQ